MTHTGGDTRYVRRRSDRMFYTVEVFRVRPNGLVEYQLTDKGGNRHSALADDLAMDYEEVDEDG